ncbi:MAG TPA: M1 family aminopeptidase, partial [Gammaproteobacteria bacterium]|nr:M1 family aminopeptidase [Gammaproteobacteria bacterium]
MKRRLASTGVELVAVLFWALPVAPQDVDVLSYTAVVEPNFETQSIIGRVHVAFTARSSTLILDAGDLVIDSVRDGGRPLPFAKRAAELHIELGTGARGGERAVDIDYHGAPRRGLSFAPDGNQVSASFATSQWLPVVDDPSERATLDLTLAVPAALRLRETASGQANESKLSLETGKTMTRWALDRPMPSYLYGFAAGPFGGAGQYASDVSLLYLGPKTLSAEQLARIFAATPDMLTFFEAKSGIDYPFRAYTQVLLRGGRGQELAGLAMFGEAYGEGVLADERNIWLGAHELAHQWWGNGVTNESWNHFWLNEGIGTFMTAAYLEHRFGRDEYRRHIDAARVKYEALRDAGHDKPLVFPAWTNPSSEDRSIVYDKGAYVIHLLREELGEDAFWAGIRLYTTRHWEQSVT